MGKQFDPIKCKVCGGAHFGTLCTKFISLRVVEPAKAVKRLALPTPKPAAIAQKVERGSSKSDVASSNLAGRSSKPKKAKKAKRKVKPSDLSEKSIAKLMKDVENHPDIQRGVHIQLKPKRDRKDYQRELMRKRRQADKTAKCITCAGTGRIDGGERGEVKEICPMCLIVRGS